MSSKIVGNLFQYFHFYFPSESSFTGKTRGFDEKSIPVPDMSIKPLLKLVSIKVSEYPINSIVEVVFTNYF